MADVRRILRIHLFILLLPLLLPAQPREIDLRGICAFHPGDDETWRSKYIDERENWNFLQAPGSWERQGYPDLDGFAWYRFRFQIPASLRGDSLVLLIDAIDDADETYFNGWLVGATGAFPPAARSECRSVRAYPLPRRMQEEFNLIAIRVFDVADSGGLTGSTIKIVMAEDLDAALHHVPREPARRPSLFLSSGSGLAIFSPVENRLTHFSSHLFRELQQDLFTENVLDRVSLACEMSGAPVSFDTLHAAVTEYYQHTGVIHQVFPSDVETFWYLPRVRDMRIIVCLLQHPVGLDLRDVRLSLSMLRPAFAFREFTRRIAGSIRHYFVLAHNSCCREFAERDLQEFLAQSRTNMYEAYELENEMMFWGDVRSALRIPFKLTEEERRVYLQSVVALVSAQVAEPGSVQGQIVSAFQPEYRRYAVPFEHLYSAASLAMAGLASRSESALRFTMQAQPEAYLFYDYFGVEFGLGIPYMVPPVKYLGSGDEYRPRKKEEAPLTVAGNGALFHAFQALIQQRKREGAARGRIVSDSSILAPYWQALSRKSADVLLQRLDSTHLIVRDCGPWGKTLTEEYSISASIWAAYGLRIASRFATAVRDTIRMVSYRLGADRIVREIDSLVVSIAAKTSAEELTPLEELVFDPLLIEAVTLGLFAPEGRTAAKILEIVEKAFRNGGTAGSFLAKPDGDWFERLERPYLTMLVAQACARMGRSEKAEEYFRYCLVLAEEDSGQFPELRDVSTGNWYGGVPAVSWGAAAFVQTAQVMHEMRLSRGGK